MKACPFCAESIQDAAIVCRYCGRDLAPAPVPATPLPPTHRASSFWSTAAWTAATMVGLILVVSMLGGQTAPSSSSATDPELAAKMDAIVAGSQRDGLIQKIELPASAAYVDPGLWASLTIDEKRGLALACAHHFKSRGEPGYANIHDGYSGKRLAHVVDGIVVMD